VHSVKQHEGEPTDLAFTDTESTEQQERRAMPNTGGPGTHSTCFHPQDEENLELHQSLTEIDEQELAVLATDSAFAHGELAER
jgi:hypothetical protein